MLVHVFVDGWIGDVSFASLSLYWTYNHSTPASVEELLGFFTLMGEKRYRVLICPFNDFVHIFKEGLFMTIRSFITLTQCWFNCHSRSVYLTSLHLLMFVYVEKRNDCNIPLTTLQDFGFTCFCDPCIWLIAGVGFGEGELVKSGDSRTSTLWFMELGRITQGLLNLLDVSLMHVMLYHIIIMAVTIKLSELWLVETRLPGICTWVTNSH